jgi:hypothetical protein
MRSPAPRGARPLPLAWPAASVLALALALAGCASASSGGPGASSASAPPATASPAATGCTADFCPPADWDTARASTPLPQIAPFSEPLNVVISARSTVSLAALQQATGDWDTVSTATSATVAGIHIKCISSESADVTGAGYVAQQAAWRLHGCADGNLLSLSGNEDHVRIWHQPVAGSEYGAWFIAASYETMCLVRDGKLQTASANKLYAIAHSGSAYHCVDGGPGTFHTTHPDGYDDGATTFAAAVVAAAKTHGWQATEAAESVQRSVTAGEGGVPFSGIVYVLTVTK